MADGIGQVIGQVAAAAEPDSVVEEVSGELKKMTIKANLLAKFEELVARDVDAQVMICI